MTLVHTEGCGATTQAEFIDTLLGYMRHPLVKNCLLLEHGCEKTHNSYWRTKMDNVGLQLEDFGWASIQQDGGIERSMVKMSEWFGRQSSNAEELELPICLGLTTGGTAGLDQQLATSLSFLIQEIVAAGGSVIMPEDDHLLQNEQFIDLLCGREELSPTIGYARLPKKAGFHIMAGRPDGWTELLTGLGASGCDLFLSISNSWPQNGHPLIPLVQVGLNTLDQGDWDFVINQQAGLDWEKGIRDLVVAVRGQAVTPLAQLQNNVDFQITRGALGISM